jgi:hypothetical protein
MSTLCHHLFDLFINLMSIKYSAEGKFLNNLRFLMICINLKKEFKKKLRQDVTFTR